MSDIDLNSIPETSAQAEALIEGIQNAPEEGAAPAQQAATEFGLNYRGKEEKYPIEKILEFAQQGRDYNEKMSGFKAERMKLENDARAMQQERQKWAKLEQKFSRYNEVENYIKQDPAWWEHVQRSYAERSSGQVPNGTNTPPDPRYAQLEQTVQKLVSNIEQREQAQVAEKEDLALNQKVSDYRDKHPQFDWTTVDENGLDLEKRILDHAIKMGLSKPEHFTLAANDYLHEEFVKRAAESAKGEVGKHIEKVNKLGLGPITDKPQLKMKRVENVASKSWDEISQEAIAAAGL